MKAKSIFDKLKPEHFCMLKRSYIMYGKNIPYFGSGSGDPIHKEIGLILSYQYPSLCEYIIHYNVKESYHQFTKEFLKYIEENH